MEPENLFRLLEEYKIEATLMRRQSAASKLLDHIDGWQKVYTDDIATVHVRKPGAVHTAEPVVDPKAKLICFVHLPGESEKISPCKESECRDERPLGIEKIYTRAKKLSSRKRRNVLQ